MRRTWTDKNGDLWVETDIPNEIVRIDSQVLGRVAEKFGADWLEWVQEQFGPLGELGVIAPQRG